MVVGNAAREERGSGRVSSQLRSFLSLDSFPVGQFYEKLPSNYATGQLDRSCPGLFPLLILNGRRSTIDSFPAGPLTTATSLLPLLLPLLVDEERRTSPRFRDKLRPPRCIKQTLLEYFTVECARYLLPVRRINKVDYLRGCTRGAAVAPRAVSMQKRTRHHPSNRSFSNSHFRSLYRGSKIESIGIDVSNVKNNHHYTSYNLLQLNFSNTYLRTKVSTFAYYTHHIDRTIEQRKKIKILEREREKRKKESAKAPGGVETSREEKNGRPQ